MRWIAFGTAIPIWNNFDLVFASWQVVVVEIYVIHEASVVSACQNFVAARQDNPHGRWLEILLPQSLLSKSIPLLCHSHHKWLFTQDRLIEFYSELL